MSSRIAGFGLGCRLLGALLVPAGAASAGEAKELFVGGKCIRCHSVEAQGIAAKPRAGEEDEVTDLSKVGAERTVEWIRQYLRKEAAIEGKKHKQKYRGSDGDLKTLATWLASLK
ncbi:MAG: c-type cytochrome [Myxococcota bacterium]